MENEAITAYRQRRAAFEATFERHLAAGVVFYSADGILIDDTVEIAPGAVIGWDMGAALSLAQALGVNVLIAAELLPEIEAVMVRKLNEQMEGRRNG